MKRGPNSELPTVETRELVQTLSGLGLSQANICAVIKVTPPTLHKHYRRELDIGMAEANKKVAMSLFEMATKDKNVTAAIFWAKTRMGWCEKNYSELALTGPDGGPVQVQFEDVTNARNKLGKIIELRIVGDNRTEEAKSA